MGMIQTTTKPYHYALLEEQKKTLLPVEEKEENGGSLTFCFSVGGLSGSTAEGQKRIEKIISDVLKKKGKYVRNYGSYSDRGQYEWDNMLVWQNKIITDRINIEQIQPILKIMKALDEQRLFPDDEILITYHPKKRDMLLLLNLQNILESRRSLIEEALSLKEPFMIIVDEGLALSITLGAFSYAAVEAAAFLMEQACKMAQSTGKSRMKPCDMTNPKFQMRSWLLRLGFIGEQFERPRRTLMEGLRGDAAFFSEDQKNRAVARRKARKMNEVIDLESA